MYAEGERVYCTRSSVPGKGGVAQESRVYPYSSFLVYFICFISFFQPYLPTGSPYLQYPKLGSREKLLEQQTPQLMPDDTTVKFSRGRRLLLQRRLRLKRNDQYIVHKKASPITIIYDLKQTATSIS